MVVVIMRLMDVLEMEESQDIDYIDFFSSSSEPEDRTRVYFILALIVDQFSFKVQFNSP